MRGSAWMVLVLVTLVSAPPAAAAVEPTFSTESLLFTGEHAVTAPEATVFVSAGSQAVAWEGFAESLLVERRYSNVTEVDKVSLHGDPQQTVVTELEKFGPSRLTAMASRGMAALLAEGAQISVRGGPGAELGVTSFPGGELRQHDGYTTTGIDGEDVHFGVRHDVEGGRLNMTTTASTVELRGTFSLQVFDIDYVLTDENGARLRQTGHYHIGALGPIQRERYEIHTITFVDAVVTVQTGGIVHTYAQEPLVAFEGQMRATGVVGAPVLGGVAFRSTGTAAEWQGQSSVPLVFAGELVGVGPETASAAGSRSALVGGEAGTLVKSLVVATGILGLLVAAALMVHRRREAASLESALLAMEERRWEDALAHLERLVAQTPTDPLLLVDRGICYENTGRLEQARTSYEAALIEAPGNAETHYYYARLLARMRMSTACLAHLSRALALDTRLAELARSEPAFQVFQDHPQFLHLLRM